MMARGGTSTRTDRSNGMYTSTSEQGGTMQDPIWRRVAPQWHAMPQGGGDSSREEAAPLVLDGTANASNTQEGSVFFIGTATVILRVGGFSILTDPNFLHRGDHVHLGYGLTSERLTDPALTLDA